jgi:hypothetical protein
LEQTFDGTVPQEGTRQEESSDEEEEGGGGDGEEVEEEEKLGKAEKQEGLDYEGRNQKAKSVAEEDEGGETLGSLLKPLISRRGSTKETNLS